jgi:hypothetical protein
MYDRDYYYSAKKCNQLEKKVAKLEIENKILKAIITEQVCKKTGLAESELRTILNES